MNSNNITIKSLHLPDELYWDGKMEPTTPPSSELFGINELAESWFNGNFDIGLPTLLDDNDDNLTVTTIADIQETLPNEDDVIMHISDTKNDYLLDAKLLDYSIGIDVAQPHTVTKVQEPLPNSTLFLPSSFDNAVLAQLTPPQSPPRNSASSSPLHNAHSSTSNSNNCHNNNSSNGSNLFAQTPNNFAGLISGIESPGCQSPASPSVDAIVLSPSAFLNAASPSPVPTPTPTPTPAAAVAAVVSAAPATISASGTATLISNAVPTNFTFTWTAGNQETVLAAQTNHVNAASNAANAAAVGGNAAHNHHLDYERDLQLLDEIVNSRAKELEEWKANEEESETQSSFSQAGSMTSDDDWQQESCYSSSVSSPNYQHSGDEQMPMEINQSTTTTTSLCNTNNNGSSGATKKRTRQYGRGVEDRKSRKKEQNKNAATRYRQRKKQEMENILVEELKLMEKNAELTKILADAKREAKYLKSLLREFYLNSKQGQVKGAAATAPATSRPILTN